MLAQPDPNRLITCILLCDGPKKLPVYYNNTVGTFFLAVRPLSRIATAATLLTGGGVPGHLRRQRLSRVPSGLFFFALKKAISS